MSSFSDPFAFFTPKRMLRLNLFVWKWAMRLVSASAELWLRKNFGRRYVLRLLEGTFCCTGCAALAPHPSALTNAFILGLYGLLAYHAAAAYSRRTRGAPEPHSFSAGNSWRAWRRLPWGEPAVQRYLEPALCLLAGVAMGTDDRFLAGWLAAAGLALFVKGQVGRLQETRRLLDAMDARHEAQALNAALAARQRPQTLAARQPHRARLPGAPPRRGP